MPRLQALLPHPRRWACALPLVLFCACSAGDGGSADQASERATPGGTAVIGLAAEPDVLNPLIRTSTVAGTVIAEMLAAAVDMDENLEWRPEIADRWELDADGRGITFHLRPWLWSDGVPLTAQDFAVSFALYKDPQVASPQRGFFADVEAAEARDDSTLHYRFVRPLPDPLERTYHNVLPAHLVADLDPAAVGSWPGNFAPLASGPFRFEAWERGRQLSLVRNERFPGAPAYLDRVVFRILPETETRVLALESGEVDLVGSIPPADARRLAEGGKVRIVATGGRQLYYVQWNFANPVFAGVGTRRALSLAIDRGRMIDALVFGYGRPAASPVAPVCWNHHGGLAANPCDPEASRRLLAADGWRDDNGDGVLERDGRELRFEILTRQGDPVRENGAVILRENLRAVGAAVTLRTLELGAALDLLRSGRFDAYFGLVTLNLYGDAAPYVHSAAVDRFNQGGYANACVDSLLQVASGTRDRAAALPIWLRLQEEVAADPPAAYLFYPEILVGVGSRLRGVKPHMLSPYNNLAEWWIPPQERKYRAGP